MTPVEVETPVVQIQPAEKLARAKAPSRPPTFPLLLEVGCEEIPARFLRDAEKNLGEGVRAALEASRLLPAARAKAAPPLRTFSTPRRLVVYVTHVLAQQADKVEEVLGPPVKVAIDAEGRYTRAAESFAQKNAASVEDLIRTTTPKGDYLALKKTTAGRSARQVLAEVLPAAILGLTFPKSMYWTAKSAPRFVRPIRWIVALLGAGKQAVTVEFEILGVKSGNYTFGHRAKSSKPLVVKGFKNYSKKLLQAGVEIDPARRLEVVLARSKALVETSGYNLLPDNWLADWMVNATECPNPVLGNFDERFLHLPREILITVMRDHQRYFAVEQANASGDPAGEPARLAPHFVAILNTDSAAQDLIRQGHQRVVTARFRDAEFFWAADQKTPLRSRLPRLEKVTYQAKLGNYADKIRRMALAAEILCGDLEAAGKLAAEERQQVLDSIDLCKCDLTTQMVQEFTELQGVVGGLYARAQGVPEAVATAIYDHYLPLGAEGASPRTLVGAAVSLADKVDSVVAGFAVGNGPTGSSDPFALRRQANGIIKVLLEFSLPIDLSKLVDMYHVSVEEHGGIGIQASVPWSKVLADVAQFFIERLRFYLESVRGLRYDNVRAAIAASPKRNGLPLIAPLDILQRVEALEGLRGSEDLEALCAAAKRIRNILTKSAGAADWTPGEVSEGLLIEPQERELGEIDGRVAALAEPLVAAREYRRALEIISTLRPAVDRFFDKVLVMAEDRATRQNRLRLLKKLDELFSSIAHFSELAEKA